MGAHQPGRRRPVQATAVRLGVLVHRGPLGHAERRERAGRLAAQRGLVLPVPDRGRRGPVEQLHVVRAGHGEIQPLAEPGQRLVGVVVAQRQGGQPEQRCCVVMPQQRPPGRVQILVDDRVEARVVDQVDQGERGDGQPAPGAVHRGRPSADRGPGQPPEQRRDPRPGPSAAGGSGTGYRALAGLRERAPRGQHRRGVPGVEPEHLIGRVQGDRTQQPGIPGREHLGEPAAIGVPVQVHPGQPQGSQHPGHIPRRVGAVEQVGGRYPAAAAVVPGVVQLGTAGRHQLVEVAAVLPGAGPLQPGAVHRGGRAGAAQVDQQQVAGGPQWAGHRQVLGFRAGGGVPGAALDREDGPGRVTGSWQPTETQLNSGARGRRVIQRHGPPAAVGEWLGRAPAQRDCADPQPGRAGCPHRRRGPGRGRRRTGWQYRHCQQSAGRRRRNGAGHARYDGPPGSHLAIVSARLTRRYGQLHRPGHSNMIGPPRHGRTRKTRAARSWIRSTWLATLLPSWPGGAPGAVPAKRPAAICPGQRLREGQSPGSCPAQSPGPLPAGAKVPGRRPRPSEIYGVK